MKTMEWVLVIGWVIVVGLLVTRSLKLSAAPMMMYPPTHMIVMPKNCYNSSV